MSINWIPSTVAEFIDELQSHHYIPDEIEDDQIKFYRGNNDTLILHHKRLPQPYSQLFFPAYVTIYIVDGGHHRCNIKGYQNNVALEHKTMSIDNTIKILEANIIQQSILARTIRNVSKLIL